MRIVLAVVLGRFVRLITRLRGGGSALPGWVALKVFPRFLEHVMAGVHRHESMPVIVVTGSNGKSTTTGMIVAALEANGHQVFSNPSGGNLPQGVASSMLAAVSLTGSLHATAVVLELDEAYGPRLVEIIKPTHALLLNVQVDQLNRFFEPERVIEMVTTIGRSAPVVLVNDADDNTRSIGNELSASGHEVRGFDVAEAAAPDGVYDASVGLQNVVDKRRPIATVTGVHGLAASVTVSGSTFDISLPAPGVHYAIDAAAALAMTSLVQGSGANLTAAAQAISSLKPVYGRGESVLAFGAPLTIIMMKNFPSLQANLDALEQKPESLYLAVDEGTPDPSWIYDVDLSAIDHVDVLAGTKAWQWETRLAYEEISVGLIEPDPTTAFAAFGQRTTTRAQTHRTAIVNYEQMMDLRRELGYREIEGE
jgi:UDP-N-acetylmuramyl pentapeptide synthase